MTVFDRSLANSENPCIEDVDRNLRLSVCDISGTVWVVGASKRLPSLGLTLQVAPVSISTALPASAGRIWRRAVDVCVSVNRVKPVPELALRF